VTTAIVVLAFVVVIYVGGKLGARTGRALRALLRQ
jgi:hypothetical protein